MIVCHHVCTVVPTLDPRWGTAVLGALFDHPAGRIEFFLVASAFLATLGYGDRVGTRGAATDFLRRRLLAILPLYWLVLAVLLVVGLTPWGYGPGHYPATRTIVASFLLIGPDPRDNILVVAWTLFHELLFYAAFALVLARPRAGGLVAAGWGLAILAGLAGLTIPFVPAYVTAPINLLFAIGAGAAIGYRRLRPAPAPLLLAALALLPGVWQAGSAGLPAAAETIGWGLVWALAIAALLAAETGARPGPKALRPPAPLLVLGNAAFAIYLVQFPVMAQVSQAVERWPWLAGNADVTAAAMIAIVVATGLALQQIAGRRLQAWVAPLRARAVGRPAAGGIARGARLT